MSADRLFKRILNALAFCSITGVDDTGSVMMVQAETGIMGVVDLPAPQQFGFSSVPPLGSDAVAHFVAGDKSNGTFTATNHQATRPTGKLPGESMQFNAFGMQIYLSENGITINGGGKNITITNAPTLIQNGDIHATGAVTAGFGSGDQVDLQAHDHNVVNVGGGTGTITTTAPIAGT